MPDSAPINPSDPHRRIRRHRYQEGPGFLFWQLKTAGRPKTCRVEGWTSFASGCGLCVWPENAAWRKPVVSWAARGLRSTAGSRPLRGRESRDFSTPRVAHTGCGSGFQPGSTQSSSPSACTPTGTRRGSPADGRSIRLAQTTSTDSSGGLAAGEAPYPDRRGRGMSAASPTSCGTSISKARSSFTWRRVT